ncbi:uncharacterized protein LOC106076992 isoform X1 [Biomphalaria glabrata]|uniref:Uncharacterized protein LOC106076992 isoform X1 n=1 Tax=Biomphalaria glabrata TaxID=6526 RepID=A0A9W3AG28_BIOGL|nr:uncharacterized protein LOC106076992 isoform X1 [Biomphalaria glabrata]
MGFLSNYVVCFVVWMRLNFLASQCPDGWFGYKCQFMCHCDKNSKCDSDGQCPTKCNAGWFGQKCQYEDLATVDGALISTSAGSGSTSWLTDRDVTTCNEDPGLDTITVQWELSFPFTWLRLQAKNASNLELNFVFTTSLNKSYSCIHKRLAKVDTATVDYRFAINETVIQMTVTGPSIEMLCSLYISGGRNVALKQTADQTGTYSEGNIWYRASLAVDGNTNSVFYNKTCSHTTDKLAQSVYPASWTLTLDTVKVINRITIYNRADSFSYRLSRFKLETLDTNNHTVWAFDDPAKVLRVYALNIMQQKPVKTIRISATWNDSYYHFPILTLCEVLVFGDCELGTWGLSCVNPCPAECRNSCQQDKGTCYEDGYLDLPGCKTGEL